MLVAATTSSPHSAARVGRHYLVMTPKEESIDTLLTLVLQRLPDPDRLMQVGDLDRIRSEVLRSVRDDFADGQMARVQGWRLSRTEARLAALAVLV
jgi:hypothetical protein